MSVEKQIAEAPVKMMGPMALLILPAMMILMLGQIVISMMSNM